MKFGHSRPISKLRIVPVIDADGEQRDHHPRPAPGERAVERVARAQMQPLGEQHHRRERDPEADQRDVHGERQRLHLARLVQVVLRDRSERCSDHVRQAFSRRAVRGGVLWRSLSLSGALLIP